MNRLSYIFLLLSLNFILLSCGENNKPAEDASLALEKEKLQLEKERLELERIRMSKEDEEKQKAAAKQKEENDMMWRKLRDEFRNYDYARVIVPRAYFYSQPDENFVKKAYLVPGDEFQIQQLSGKFLYTVFENAQTGYVTKGWIKITDVSGHYYDY